MKRRSSRVHPFKLLSPRSAAVLPRNDRLPDAPGRCHGVLVPRSCTCPDSIDSGGGNNSHLADQHYRPHRPWGGYGRRCLSIWDRVSERRRAVPRYRGVCVFEVKSTFDSCWVLLKVKRRLDPHTDIRFFPKWTPPPFHICWPLIQSAIKIFIFTGIRQSKKIAQWYNGRKFLQRNECASGCLRTVITNWPYS